MLFSILIILKRILLLTYERYFISSPEDPLAAISESESSGSGAEVDLQLLEVTTDLGDLQMFKCTRKPRRKKKVPAKSSTANGLDVPNEIGNGESFLKGFLLYQKTSENPVL